MTVHSISEKSTWLRIVINIGTVVGVILAVAGMITYGQGQTQTVARSLEKHNNLERHSGAVLADERLRADTERLAQQIAHTQEIIDLKLETILEKIEAMERASLP